MKYIAKTPSEYIELLPDDRKMAVEKIRNVIRENLSNDFEETMLYDMISFVIPKSKYPNGYHCNPEDPIAFISLASQKNHIAIYHMGVYMFEDLKNWITEEYKKRVGKKIDMGKSCIRLKNVENIPYELLGELCRKISVDEFIEKYESQLNKK